MECVPEGFKAMVPAILILTFAWTLKAMTDSLGAAEYVANVMQSAAGGLLNFLPAIIFLVGCFLAFATGTSWGTFGILIPIVVAVFQGTNETMMIISISACMAGAVCGDHCSPISDIPDDSVPTGDTAQLALYLALLAASLAGAAAIVILGRKGRKRD